MVTASNKRATVPPPVLGYSFSEWRKFQIRTILDHYGYAFDPALTKRELMEDLRKLTEQQSLCTKDRGRILAAHGIPNRPDVREPLVTGPRPISGEINQETFHVVSQPPAATGEDDHSLTRDETPRSCRLGRAESSSSGGRIPQPECIVCFSLLHADNMLQRNVTSACEHIRDICVECVTASVSAQFTYKMWNHIECPSCGERLEHQDVQAFADKETFERYDAFSLEAYLGSSQFQRCRMPNCESGQQCFPEEDHFIICQECNGRTCIKCDTIWHSGLSCDEAVVQREAAEARKLDEEASTEYLNNQTKLCPGCGVHSVKISGCDHITCHKCRHQYCWVCLADYAPISRNGNQHHNTECRYHSDHLPGATVVGHREIGDDPFAPIPATANEDNDHLAPNDAAVEHRVAAMPLPIPEAGEESDDGLLELPVEPEELIDEDLSVAIPEVDGVEDEDLLVTTSMIDEEGDDVVLPDIREVDEQSDVLYTDAIVDEEEGNFPEPEEELDIPEVEVGSRNPDADEESYFPEAPEENEVLEVAEDSGPLEIEGEDENDPLDAEEDVGDDDMLEESAW